MDTGSKYRFDPVDHNFMRLRGRLTPGERLLAMLAAREWVVSAKRARLCRRYPELSPQEINLKVLEEIERAERRQTRYLEADPTLADTFDEVYLDAQARALGPAVEELWQSIKQAAQDAARREDTQDAVAF